MPHDKGTGKPLFQFSQQGKQAATLGRRARIGRMSGCIQPAFIADAYGVPVMPLTMCTDAFQRSSTVNLAVARDVEMVTDVAESPSAYMLYATGFKIQAPPLRGSGAMDNNQGNCPHAAVNLHTN